MREVHSTVRLAAGRGRVWRFVTDPEHFAEWVAGCTGHRVTTPQATGPGAAYAWSAGSPPWRIEVHEHVVRWEDEREVAYEGRVGPIRFRSRMQVEDHGPDATRLETGIEVHVPVWLGGRPAERAFRPMLEVAAFESLQRLRGRFGGVPRDDAGPTPGEVVAAYRRLAGGYDFVTSLYRFGFPLARYRRLAVDALALRPGAMVVEIGCGTGANFALLQRQVGAAGRIVGIDLTDAMLEQARRRVAAAGWTNVELVQSDAAHYAFPEGVNGILSTLALTLSPDYAEIIERGARALAPGGRWVILDLKLPERLPAWASAIGLAVARPYVLSVEGAGRRPWEALERHMAHTRMQELYLGTAYLATGING